MESTKTLLDLPVRTAARRVSLTCLAEAGAAAGRVREREDPAALRDFRRTLRRLRVLMKAFQDALDDTVDPRTRERLKKLLEGIGTGAEWEVQIAWLDRLLADEPEGRIACEPLHARLVDLGRVERKGAGRAVKRFQRFAKRLTKQLSRYEVSVGEGEGEAGDTAESLARALRAAASDLRERLTSVVAPVDVETVDRARAGVARLYYLVEPFEGELPGGEGLAQRLKVLEKVLGDLHALDALSARVGRYLAESGSSGPGLDVLSRRLRMRRDEAARELSARCAGSEGDAIVALVERLCADLGEPGDVEIERKYLLSALPEIPEGAEVLVVEQGWFGTRPPERVRRTRGRGGARFFRAIKHGRGVKRLELEEAIPEEMFDALWPLTEGRRVVKTRYRVPVGDLWWEIDHFDDRELTLAEVEIPSVDHVAAPPDWLAPHIVREVTEEGGYVNLNLAR